MYLRLSLWLCDCPLTQGEWTPNDGYHKLTDRQIPTHPLTNSPSGLYFDHPTTHPAAGRLSTDCNCLSVCPSARPSVCLFLPSLSSVRDHILYPASPSAHTEKRVIFSTTKIKMISISRRETFVCNSMFDCVDYEHKHAKAKANNNPSVPNAP